MDDTKYRPTTNLYGVKGTEVSVLCQPWEYYLSDVADAVEKLINQNRTGLEEFKRRIQPFGNQWRMWEDWAQKDEAIRTEHIKTVEQRPDLLKKGIKPSEKNYLWDDGYFECLGLEDMDGCWGPEVECPLTTDSDPLESYLYRSRDTGLLSGLDENEEIDRYFVLLSCIHYGFHPDTSFVKSVWPKELIEHLRTWCNPVKSIGHVLHQELGPGKAYIDVALNTVRGILDNKQLEYIMTLKEKKATMDAKRAIAQEIDTFVSNVAIMKRWRNIICVPGNKWSAWKLNFHEHILESEEDPRGSRGGPKSLPFRERQKHDPIWYLYPFYEDPPSLPEIEEQHEVLERYLVILTYLHDYYCPVIRIATKRIWTRDLCEAIGKCLGITAWDKPDFLRRAWNLAKTDLCLKPRHSIDKTNALKKFHAWQNPGDACIIIDDHKILFHHGDKTKNLRLKSHTQTSDLLVMLQGGSLQSSDIKKDLCKGTTKPSQLVYRANRKLNDCIKKVGFKCLPDQDVEFVRYDKEFNHYTSFLPIHLSLEKFEFAPDNQI